MQTAEAANSTSEVDKSDRDGRIVLRNTMYLGIAEVLTMPIAVLLNAVMGRYLGPEDIGHIYLAGTISGLAFMAVSWGHHGSMPPLVIQDQASAGKYLGSSVVWRSVTAVLLYLLVAGICHLLGSSAHQQWAIGLVFLAGVLNTNVAACQDAARGFERTDIAAYARVGSQLFALLLVLPVLMLGGGLRLTLLAQAASVLFVLIPILRKMTRRASTRSWRRARRSYSSGSPSCCSPTWTRFTWRTCRRPRWWAGTPWRAGCSGCCWSLPPH
jgi:O-antigen/teichoic acid export membrane protein